MKRLKEGVNRVGRVSLKGVFFIIPAKLALKGEIVLPG